MGCGAQAPLMSEPHCTKDTQAGDRAVNSLPADGTDQVLACVPRLKFPRRIASLFVYSGSQNTLLHTALSNQRQPRTWLSWCKGRASRPSNCITTKDTTNTRRDETIQTVPTEKQCSCDPMPCNALQYNTMQPMHRYMFIFSCIRRLLHESRTQHHQADVSLPLAVMPLGNDSGNGGRRVPAAATRESDHGVVSGAPGCSWNGSPGDAGLGLLGALSLWGLRFQCPFMARNLRRRPARGFFFAMCQA